MRTQLKLWQIVKDNFDEYFEYGLCNVIGRLRVKGTINTNEYFALLDELEHFGDTEDYFLGKKGDPKPRLEFIEKMIKKHSQ